MNVLMCLDQSAASQKAVQFAAGLLSKLSVSAVHVTLFHVAELLPEYLLNEQSSAGLSARDLAKAWSERAQSHGQKLLAGYHQDFVKAGLPAANVHEKLSTTSCLPEAKKVAAALSMIEEIRSGKYEIVCLGRGGSAQTGSSLIGGVAEKVIRECAGKTVWLVD